MKKTDIQALKNLIKAVDDLGTAKLAMSDKGWSELLKSVDDKEAELLKSIADHNAMFKAILRVFCQVQNKYYFGKLSDVFTRK